MKRGKNNFRFSNRVLYTLITLGILSLFAVGVYAYGSGSPTTVGHTGNEISVDSTLCSAITGHGCGYDIDTDTDTNTWGPVAGGLYGLCQKSSVGCNAYGPAYCSSGVCACPGGYTLVSTGAVVTPSTIWYTCIKS